MATAWACWRPAARPAMMLATVCVTLWNCIMSFGPTIIGDFCQVMKHMNPLGCILKKTSTYTAYLSQLAWCAAMHDLDPVFRDFSRSDKVAQLLRALNYKCPLPVQSMFIFKVCMLGSLKRDAS